ncbi:hypothetical protein C8R46DRAFT_1216361 [Mycena filopes]|nr:hypothetical protein C8R46DRAFT_1216361 [Mycena filopes]
MNSSYPPVFADPQGPSLRARESSSGGVQLDRDADFLVQSFLPPSPISHQGPAGIPLPFCTPQSADSFDAPFARGYNPALHDSVGISQDQLLQFIDGLNLAITSSPPLRVVNLAGTVIGFIPFHWAMIAGTVIQTVAQTGAHILSKTLTDRYLRAANLRLFKPKGLVVRLCTTAAMQHLVMRTGNGVGPSTMTKIGRGVGTVLLHAPIPFSSRIVRSIADKPPTVHAGISDVGDGRQMSLAAQRRLASLEGYALPLQLDVPPPTKAQGVMNTMGTWGVEFDQWRTGRKQDRIERKRRQLKRVNSQLRHLDIDPNGGPLQTNAPSEYDSEYSQSRYGSGDQMAGRRPGYTDAVSSAYAVGRPRGEFSGVHTVGRREQKADRKHMKEELKAERREMKAEQKELRREGKDAAQKAVKAEWKELRREGKDLRKAEKLARKRERGPGLLGSLIGPKETKLERRVANADLIEHWQSQNGLWLVIMNAELDSEIEGFERADSLDNEEYVDPQTWRTEITKEKVILEEEDSQSDGDGDSEDDVNHKANERREHYKQ